MVFINQNLIIDNHVCHICSITGMLLFFKCNLRVIYLTLQTRIQLCFVKTSKPVITGDADN